MIALALALTVAAAPSVRWTATLPGAPMRACAVDGDAVYQGVVGAKGRALLVALDRDTGRVRWRVEVGRGGVHAAPAVAGDVVVHGGFDGDVVGVDARTGAVRWRSSAAGDGLLSTPIVRGGAAWVGAVGGWAAIDVATGATRLRGATNAGAAVLFVDDAIALVHDMPRNVVAAIDARTGAERWTLRGPVLDRARGVHAGFQAEQVAADAASLYVPTNVAETWAVDRATGAKRWGWEPGGATFGTTLVDDAVFLASSLPGAPARSLVARVDAGTGVERWRADVRGIVHAVPIVVEGVVVVPTEREGVLLLDAASGARRGAIRAGAGWWAGCAADGVAYASDERRRLRAIAVR